MQRFILIDSPDQQFEAILEQRRVTLRVRYNTTAKRWTFDLSVDDQPVLHGRRIVRGIDLLAPFDFGIGIIFATEDSPTEPHEPNYANMIEGLVRLYQTTTEEIDAAISA